MPLPVEFRGSKYPAHYQFISQYENGKIKEMTKIGIAVSYMEGFANQVLVWMSGGVAEMSKENYKSKSGL